MKPGLICTQTEDNCSSLLKFLQDLNNKDYTRLCINRRGFLVYPQDALTKLISDFTIFQGDNKVLSKRPQRLFTSLSMSILGVVLFSISTTVCFQLVKVFVVLQV